MTEQNVTTKLLQRRGFKSISLSAMPLILLYSYLAINTLTYIDWFPRGLMTLSLYGFIFVSAIECLIRGKMKLSTHNVWYIGFVFICAVSCVYAPKQNDALRETIDLIKVLVFCVMVTNVLNTQQRIETALMTFSVSATMLFIYLAITGQIDTGERLGSELTGNANTFALLFMIGAIFAVYFIFFGKNQKTRLFFGVTFLVHLLALAMAGGRKFFLIPIVLCAGMYVMHKDKIGRRNLAANSFKMVVVLSIVWWAIFNIDFLYDNIGYRMEGLVNLFLDEGDADFSSLARKSMMETGLKLWLQSPIWGHGIDSFKYISVFDCYAHNNYVELLCDIGIVGTIYYYAFFVYLLAKFCKSNISIMHKSYWTILVSCLMVFDIGAVSYDLLLPHFMFAVAAVITYQTKTNVH